jgi:hypothetical protein
VVSPSGGAPAAASRFRELAHADPILAAACPVPLTHPGQPALPDHAWRPVPAHIAHTARPAPADAPTAALVLLDRDRQKLTAAGPFADRPAARRWNPTPPLDPAVDRLVVPLHPATPALNLA